MLTLNNGYESLVIILNKAFYSSPKTLSISPASHLTFSPSFLGTFELYAWFSTKPMRFLSQILSVVSASHLPFPLTSPETFDLWLRFLTKPELWLRVLILLQKLYQFLSHLQFSSFLILNKAYEFHHKPYQLFLLRSSTPETSELWLPTFTTDS